MDMLEKVARAIDPFPWENWDNWVKLKDFNEAEKAKEFERASSLHKSLARAEAAIEALRDLTPSMRLSGESAATVGIGRPNDEEAIPRVWKAMLDAVAA